MRVNDDVYVCYCGIRNLKYPDNLIDGHQAMAIDLIKPASTFEKEEMHMANHYTNLQPLRRKIKLQKGNEWEWEDEKFWLQNIIYQEKYSDPYLPTTFEICPE